MMIIDAPRHTRKQPIAPLILMAFAVLVVCTPSALASNGLSANPVTLMKQIGEVAYRLTGLIAQSNESLSKIDVNSKRLFDVGDQLDPITTGSANMAKNTEVLNTKLADLGGTVASQREKLGSVQAKLTQTSNSMGAVSRDLNGANRAMGGIRSEFKSIDTSVASMNKNLRLAITEINTAAPLTKEFASNRTRVAIAGGSSKKFKVKNIAPDARVMDVVLPLIYSMQNGGALPARKDSHKASNILVGSVLKLQVPDGANVQAIIQPYDGFYGLPKNNFFVANRIHGF